jgi:hypothetical protein
MIVKKIIDLRKPILRFEDIETRPGEVLLDLQTLLRNRLDIQRLATDSDLWPGDARILESIYMNKHVFGGALLPPHQLFLPVFVAWQQNLRFYVRYYFDNRTPDSPDLGTTAQALPDAFVLGHLLLPLRTPVAPVAPLPLALMCVSILQPGEGGVEGGPGVQGTRIFKLCKCYLKRFVEPQAGLLSPDWWAQFRDAVGEVTVNEDVTAQLLLITMFSHDEFGRNVILRGFALMYGALLRADNTFLVRVGQRQPPGVNSWNLSSKEAFLASCAENLKQVQAGAVAAGANGGGFHIRAARHFFFKILEAEDDGKKLIKDLTVL